MDHDGNVYDGGGMDWGNGYDLGKWGFSSDDWSSENIQNMG